MLNSLETAQASDLKRQALSLFRTHRSDQARMFLLDALATSPGAATLAITDIVEANPSIASMRDLLAAGLKTAPGQARLWFATGRQSARDGAMDAAIDCFSRAHRLAPSDPEFALALGVALKHGGRLQEALGYLRIAHGLAATPVSKRVLAEAELEANHPESAQALYAELLHASPADSTLRLRLAETHSQTGGNQEAIALLRRGLELTPDEPGLHMALAQLLEDEGDGDAAERAYSAALELRPDWPVALAGLIGVRRGRQDGDLERKALQILQSPATTAADKAPLGYALGKLLDRSGRYADAMRAWDIANAAREITAGTHDPGALLRHLEDLEAHYGHPQPAADAADNDSPRIVFIVGMPRSGTTLTERLLAAHPSVHGCGELPDLPRIASELGPGWPALATTMPAESLQALRADYLRSACRNAAPGKRVFVDKAPLNFFQLGLAQALFPDARVIWCRRDRRDVALSIYSENFSPASTFSTSFEGIAAYQDADERLLRLWRRSLRLPILVQDYESLAGDPERGARVLLEFAGLEWHPDVLRSHEKAGNVQTPSRWQVREPVHTRSIGRWRNYPEQFPG